MKARPIIFNGPSIRAICAGRKTQTRRVVKPPRWSAPDEIYLFGGEPCVPDDDQSTYWIDCPYGQPGDLLWVRETWGVDEYDDGQHTSWFRYVYRADIDRVPMDNGTETGWESPIYMPRRASRLTLRVTGVRVERLQEITCSDAEAEGAFDAPESDKQQAARVGLREGVSMVGPRDYFRQVWDTINAKRGFGWDADPWVWVIEFERIEK